MNGIIKIYITFIECHNLLFDMPVRILFGTWKVASTAINLAAVVISAVFVCKMVGMKYWVDLLGELNEVWRQIMQEMFDFKYSVGIFSKKENSKEIIKPPLTPHLITSNKEHSKGKCNKAKDL